MTQYSRKAPEPTPKETAAPSEIAEKAAGKEASSDASTQVEQRVRRKAPQETNKNEPKIHIPTGSTLLNCACSDKPFGGFAGGTMVNWIGDSSAGKTMGALTCLACTAYDPRFEDYELVLDDVEAALLIDMERMFGKKAARRIVHYNEGNGKRSDDIYSLYGNVARILDKGKPFIYVVDSMDAIATTEDADRVAQILKDPEKVKGTYGMQKPKMLSEILRNICGGLSELQSLLIVISQIRDKTDARPGQSTKTRAGGKALKFYATHEMWMTAIKTHKDSKYKRVLGADVNIKVAKNKINGKVREAEFPIWYDYGIDDTTSCVQFMNEYGPSSWAVSGGRMACPLLGGERLFVKDVVRAIEDAKLVRELRFEVGQLWMEIEESLKLQRKPRFEE